MRKRTQMARKREQLLKMQSGAITLEEVAVVFGVQLSTARKYAQLGIVWSTDRNGNQYLYELRDVRAAYKRYKTHHTQGMTLPQIGRLIRDWVTADLSNSTAG